MNICELYSLSSGQKLDKIWTYEKYFPIPFEKYVVIQPFSKSSKNYDYWQNVIDIILPYLERENIKLVQVGGANEQPLVNCHHTQGKTNWGNLQHIISKSLAVLSADSVSSHLAGHYDKPLVVLISNNFKECISPYYGDKAKQIILEPDRVNKNPSFALDEGSRKQINEILPETVALSILKLLNIKYKPSFKTLWFGPFYNNKMIHLIPNQTVNPAQLGLQSLIVRMDIEFNEQLLAQQLQICPCSIITNKPINNNLLRQFKPRILEVVYLIDKNHKPEFAQALADLRIKYKLISELENEELNKIKFSYIDFNLIIPKDDSLPEELKNTEIEKLFYTTTQLYLGSGKIYSSEYAYRINQPLKDFNHTFQQVFPQNGAEQFFNSLKKEKEFIYFAEKID